MTLTLTGIGSIFCIIRLFAKEKKKALLDSRLLILLNYFFFWGKVHDLEINWYYDILMFLSFVIFYGIVCFLYHQKLLFNRKIISLLPLENSPACTHKQKSSKLVTVLYLFVSLTIVLNLFYYSTVYDGLEYALIRFYGRYPENPHPAIYEMLFAYMIKISAIGMATIHYIHASTRKSAPFYYYFLLWGLILISFSTGTRGHILFPVILILSADLFISIQKRKPLRKNVFRFSNIILILVSLILFLFLTEHRTTYYNNIHEVFDDFAKGDYLFANHSEESGISQEKDLVMKDYYFVLDIFPKQFDHLPLFTSLSTVICNPVPRSFWADKPSGFGRKLAAIKADQDHTDDAYIATEIHTADAVGIHGEGYANGGIAGMLFYTVLLGILSGVLANFCQLILHYSNPAAFILTLVFIQTPSCYIRGDILSGVSLFIFPAIGLCFFLIFINFISNKNIRKAIACHNTYASHAI